MGNPLEALARWSRTGAARGIVLCAAVALALALANTPLAAPLAPLFHGRFHYWINHGAMALFFLLVGLEIKRELLEGELGSRRRMALPLAAAAGGMVLPAAIYLAVAHGPLARGWGIATSTDTAFAIGVLGLLGRRVPPRLRLFLTAFAIVDDVLAVAIISLFYSSGLSWPALALAAAALAALAALNRLGVRRLAPYLAGGALVWLAMTRSGVHATVAGILVAATVPGRGERSPLRRLEHALDPWVTLVVLPLFALSNAGIDITPELAALARHPTTIGIALGLLVGKPAGVLGGALAVVKLGWAKLPDGVSWRQVLGAAVLAGIGFTMSIFIATIAFGDEEVVSLDDAKLAVLASSLVAALAGSAILRRRVRHAGCEASRGWPAPVPPSPS